MGTLNSELAKEGHSFTFVLINHTKHIFKMVDNVETTTPTVEEATNGASETATTEGSKTEEVTAEGDEATKRKADAPSEDETVEKIAKLKESAAEVVSEAEKKLPEEPLTEAEATA